MQNDTCSSLKEAIDKTYQKNGIPVSKALYLTCLQHIVNGDFMVITRDCSARDYTEKHARYEIEHVWNQIEGKDDFTLTTPPLEDMVGLVAEYFDNFNNYTKQRNFTANSSEIDNRLLGLSVKEKNDILLNAIFGNETSQFSDVDSYDLKLTIVENAYRLLRYADTKADNISFYFEPIAQQSKEMLGVFQTYETYLRGIFSGFSSDNMIWFIKQITDENIISMVNMYNLTRRNKDNIKRIGMAETLSPNGEIVKIFNAFSSKDTVENIKRTNSFHQ